MNKAVIQEKLRTSHQQFTSLVLSLSDTDFLFCPPGKWTAGQQLDHIYRAVAAVNQGLLLPKFVIRIIIGKANRPSRNFDELVLKYKTKLEQGGTARGRFVPKPVRIKEKNRLGKKLGETVEALCQKMDRYSEQQLDYYILPHPLLGKLTIREMLYFTIYHVAHHEAITLRNLER